MNATVELFYDDEVERCIYEDLNQSNNYNIADCIICLQLIVPSDFITANHDDINHPDGYHKECWNHYITKFDSCPLCRMKFVPINDELEQQQQQQQQQQQEQPQNPELHFIEYYTREQMMAMETILFLTTLGHSVYMGSNSNVFLHVLKSCVSFYITCRTMSTYLQNIATSKTNFLLCFCICYSIVSNILENYNIIIDTIYDTIQYQMHDQIQDQIQAQIQYQIQDTIHNSLEDDIEKY
jgi:hypothetical protein